MLGKNREGVIMTKLEMKGKSGRIYDVKIHGYGDNNVEIVLVYGGLVMSSEVRPTKGRGADKSYEALVDRADEQATRSTIRIVE